MRTIRGTTVCVVGGAGFLGSHLVNHLVEDRDCDVIVVDNLCVGRREFVHPKAKFFHHDITGSEEFLRTLFHSSTVQYVFNYAAWPYIPDSFERPLQVFAVNATGAIKVINAAQEAGVDAILQVSSAELYGSATAVPGISDPMWITEGRILRTEWQITEEQPVVPHSTYGAAKAAVDYYCQSAWKERRTPVISMRQFNCVGERETHPYVIPEIISQLADQPEVRLGNNSERDFLYAGDAVAMAVELLEKGQFGEVYNLGSEDSIKIYDLAREIGQLMDWERVDIVEDETRKRPWEIWYLRSDNSKVHRLIDRRPQVTRQEALKRTIQDFVNNGDRWIWEPQEKSLIKN